MIERLVAALLARESCLAHDAQGERGQRRHDQRASGGGDELRRQHGEEATGEQEQERAHQDRPAGEAEEQSRLSEPIGERAGRAVEHQRAEADEGRDQADPAGVPVADLCEPGRQERSQATLDVAYEDVDGGKVRGRGHRSARGALAGAAGRGQGTER